MVVTGTGSPTDPWVLNSTPAATGSVNILDTGSLDLVRTGSGVPTDPYIVSGHVRLAAILAINNTGDVQFTQSGTGTDGSILAVSADLKCLDCDAPGNTGDVLTRQADGTYKPLSISVPAGSVHVGNNLTGDGTVANPLKLDICTYADLKAICVP